MFDAGGNEVCSSEYLVILFGVPTAFGSVDDLFCLFIPMDFFQGEWSAKHIFGKLLTGFAVEWQCGCVACIEGESTGFPGKELIGLFSGKELFINESFDEKRSENLFEWGKAFVLIQRVEAILRIDQAVGGRQSMDDGDSGDLSMR